jgi:hypothetical protein
MDETLYRANPALCSKLDTLRRYYEVTHGVGHTHTLMVGTSAAPRALILGATEWEAEAIAQDSGLPRGQARSWNADPALFAAQLQGHREPLAIDNQALILLLGEALAELDRLASLLRLLTEHERTPL